MIWPEIGFGDRFGQIHSPEIGFGDRSGQTMVAYMHISYGFSELFDRFNDYAGTNTISLIAHMLIDMPIVK